MTGKSCPPSLRDQLRGAPAPALQVACPHCKAIVGKPCVGPSGRKLHQAHATREETAGLRPKVVTDAEQRDAS